MQYSAVDNWDQHWAGFSEASSQSPATKYRIRLILNLLDLARPYADAHLIELGSGTGDFAAAFHRAYPSIPYTGLELSATGVGISRKRVPGCRFLERNLLLPAGEEDFTAQPATHAVCSEVLEHLDEPVLLLRNASRYLQPGCRLIVTVPSGRMSEFDRHIGHRRHFTAQSLASLLDEAGFAAERVYAPGFPFFNLFRLLVRLRGRKLVDDVSHGTERAPLHVRFGSALFDALFRLNLMRWGCQLIAVARLRG